VAVAVTGIGAIVFLVSRVQLALLPFAFSLDRVAGP
jgi:hypothetical protein